MLRFLIDECLSPFLATEALSLDIEATHVNWLNLKGYRDRSLLPIILDADYVFVTNNAIDFRALYGRLDLHPGLVIILPSVGKTDQIALFLIALAHIRTLPDVVDRLIEIDAAGTVTLSDFPPSREEP